MQWRRGLVLQVAGIATLAIVAISCRVERTQRFIGYGPLSLWNGGGCRHDSAQWMVPQAQESCAQRLVHVPVTESATL